MGNLLLLFPTCPTFLCFTRLQVSGRRLLEAVQSLGLTKYTEEDMNLGRRWANRPVATFKALFLGTVFCRDACFLDLGTVFLDLYMFFGPNQIFFWDLGSQKMWGTCLCVFWTLWGYFFFRPACICAGPRDFFRQPN